MTNTSTDTSTAGSNSTPNLAVIGEEGLQRHYDVILCGTGLIQSILAAALARQGMSCLQLDEDDVYGELERIWTHDKLQEWQQRLQRSYNFVSTMPADSDRANTAVPRTMDIPLADRGHGLAGLEFHSTYPSSPKTLAVSSLVQTPVGPGRVTFLDASKIQTLWIPCRDQSDWHTQTHRHPPYPPMIVRPRRQ